MKLFCRGFGVLTEAECRRIFEAAVRVFRRVPLRVQGTDEFCDYLSSFGCEIEGESVRFPEAVVDKTLARIEEHRGAGGLGSPPHARLGSPPHARLESPPHAAKPAVDSTALLSGAEPDQDPWGSTLSYSVSGQALWCCDTDTGQLRSATTQDLAEFSHLIDAIPNLGRAHPTYIPQDVPVGSAEIHAFATIMLNSKRPHRVSCYSERMLPYFIELQTIADGSLEAVKKSPTFAAKVWFNTPFMITEENIRIGMKARELLGQPLMISTMPVAGMATPVTLAGCLVQSAAEVLMCNAMTLAVDDRVCGWTAGPLAFDMRTGIHTQTAPEVSLLLLGASELACHIFGGRPAATGGPTCAAKAPGAQSMMEKAVNADFAIAGGCRSFGSLALLAFADIGSLVQLMLDLELMSYYERLLQGIEVSEGKLAEELICEVGPTGARYLDTDHTAEHYREEVWLPELLDRRTPMAWADDPVTMLDNARKKARRLLATAENQCPLADEQRREVERIVAAADREVAEDARA